MDYIHHYDSPLGGMTMASDGTALIGLWFDGQKHFADALGSAHEEKQLDVFRQTDLWLDAYFRGMSPGFTPPLRMRATNFRKAVWEILLLIPYGKTMSYAEIAALVARQRGLSHMSARAVGGAVGHNSIALIIPCHRVIGSDGRVTGYAGGIRRKLLLLSMEGADTAHACKRSDADAGLRRPSVRL